MKSIVNLDASIDYLQEPMFLGHDLNVQRYDRARHQFFYNNFQTQLGFFWRPEEVELVKDRADFKGLSDYEEFMFTSNLKYQTLLDSIQSRGIPFLGQYVSLPELEVAFKAWEFFETLHSYSYTYIIQNVYSDPSHVFDNILTDQELVKRAKSITRHYNTLVDCPVVGEGLKEKIYLTLASINILEGIRFYVSFGVSYAFAENKKMEGNAKVIYLINRDENVHLNLTQHILRRLRNEDNEGFLNVVKNNEQKLVDLYAEASQEEMDWAKYIFHKGSILGLNDKLLVEYMKWLTNKRMRAIGLKELYDKASNPLEGWISNWTDSKKVQAMPQETEMESYRIGSYINDTDKVDFSKYGRNFEFDFE